MVDGGRGFADVRALNQRLARNAAMLRSCGVTWQMLEAPMEARSSCRARLLDSN